LEGAKIAWGSPTNTASYPEDSFDVVYDNNGKDLEACQPAIDHFKVHQPLMAQSYLTLICCDISVSFVAYMYWEELGRPVARDNTSMDAVFSKTGCT
jgi:hypothetical protein